jgi:SapC
LINNLLHRQVVAVDSNVHRATRLRVPHNDWSFSSQLNSMFIAATEFGDTCREYPIVFVSAGKDEKDKPVIAPIAVFGVSNNENLFLDKSAWRGRYVPAMLRVYPFCTAKINAEQFAVCLDASWPGLSTTEGEPLYGADGKPTELLAGVQKQLETLETEVQRTRLLCQRLQDLALLRDMRFDATFGDGRKHSVEGFLTVDQAKVDALPDATLLELHKQGVLGLIHAHWISLGNMRTLLDWHQLRHPSAQGAAPAPVAANSAA